MRVHMCAVHPSSISSLSYIHFCDIMKNSFKIALSPFANCHFFRFLSQRTKIEQISTKTRAKMSSPVTLTEFGYLRSALMKTHYFLFFSLSLFFWRGGGFLFSVLFSFSFVRNARASNVNSRRPESKQLRLLF